jgi:hypothetical protein
MDQTVSAERIPPVSFARFDADFDRFSQALGDSFARYGFAIISDHGIPPARITAALDAAKAFFALPAETKLKYKLPVAGQRGYTAFGVETAKGETHHDLKEFWHVGRELPEGHRYRRHMPENVWPDADAPQFHTDVQWLYDALDTMGLKVLEAISVYLDLDRRFFDDKVDLGNSILRLLHYPPVPIDGPHIRAAAHEDINVITFCWAPKKPASRSGTTTAAGSRSTRRKARWSATSATCCSGSPTTACPPPRTGWSIPRRSAGACRATRRPSSCTSIRITGSRPCPAASTRPTRTATPSRSPPTNTSASGCARSSWPERTMILARAAFLC